jgi:hypothetical protein
MRYPVLFLLLALLVASLPLPAQIAGVNVNMVSGISWPDGDPFLQRQNEPSLAVSSRNTLHLLGGANDYRTVDLPGLPNGETGDAWLGIFKSYDGGQTWKSTLLPGCPQNVAVCNGAPALKGYAAAADPVVRTGTNGMFYYSGIGFTRTSPAKSVVFVSRFIDNNNEENGDPIKFIDANPVATGTATIFVDKPWMAVDIPRAGAATCSIAAPQSDGSTVKQTFPGGNIYIAYTTFTTDGQPPSSIQFVRSTDCGATWSKPLALSDNVINQGATLAIDPLTGTLYVAWRRFATAAQLDGIMIAKSTDGGQTFSKPVQVAAINPFDQGTTDFSFRTNAYPTMAVDGSGRVYLAWTERAMGGPASGGDARTVLTTSKDGGNTWTQRQPVNDAPSRGHQLMPAMTFGGGKLIIVFYDLRDDATTGVFTALGQGQYSESRAPAGDLATVPPHPEKVFTQYILDAAPADLNEGGLLRRHTVDVWAVQADPADKPSFTAARVSQYVFGSVPGSSVLQQLQVNPPNFPLFSQGTVPFAGDYLDVAASPSIVPGTQAGTWKFNIDPSPSIVFHATWADNRDVRPPANGDWTDYTPPVSSATTGNSIYDPTKPQPSCITGQTGMRNENIYTSRITQGLAVSSPSDAKTLGKIQRSFPIVVENSTNLAKTYRLTIVNQPPGGEASFLQFPAAGLPDPLAMLDVSVAPISSISRMVFVTSTSAQAPILINVAEITAPGAPGIRLGGLQGSVLLNPDPSNPANPAIANNELFNPAIANPAIANPAIANPAIANPAIANPAIANPAIANPAIANLSTSNADIANPAIANPAIANPAIANPAIANTAITDANWALTNNGNSAGTYSVHFLISVTIPSRVLSQLIVNRVYNTPVASGCSLVQQPQTVVIANVSGPPIVPQKNFASTGVGRTISAVLRRRVHRQRGKEHDRDTAASDSDITDPSLDDATVTIGPGETVYVTLRFFNTDATQPLGFDPGADITTVSVSHAVDTGGTQPPVASSHLIAATGPLPPAVVGGKYDDFLLAAGGQGPYTWSLASGALPGGLSLTPAGEITGTITGVGGTFNFVVQVTDSTNAPPVQEALSIQVSGVALAFSGVAAASAGAGAGQTITVAATVTNSGTQADNVVPIIAVNTTGSATASCGAPAPASASLASNGQQVFTFFCGSVSGTGTLSFSVSLSATDSLGANLSISPATSNIINLLGTPPTVSVSATSGGSPYASGAWTNQSVVVSITCTPAVGTPSTRQITVTSEGANQSVNTSCTDTAGNSVNASFSGINIDYTPPVVTASATVNGVPYTSGTPTNQPVLVTFTCTDALSGVVSQPPAQTIQPPAVGQSVTGTCTDRAGNVGSATFGGITTGSLPPTMGVTYSNGYTPGSWSAVPVTVVFTCSPASGLGIQSLTPPATLSAQGSNQSVTGRCTDSAGNTGQITAGPINIETTAPQLTLQSLPQASSGWYNTPVTITWLCADIVANTHNTIVRTVSTEGANQVVTLSCANQAGTTVTGSQTVSVDLTAPVIKGAASPAPGSSGWNTTPVAVTFTCTDALSGVASGNPTGNTTVTADTNGSVVTGSCRDVAGNVASATIGPVRLDRTPPVIQFQSVSPINAAGWSNGPVTVTWSCADAGSGPVSATVTQQVTGDGTNQSATATCADVAGNTAGNTHTGIKIDTVAPLIRFFSPGDGQSYVQGAAVSASYSCSDNSSGVAGCTGDLPNGQPVPTDTLGPHTFTVTATDVAGNVTKVVHTYTVTGKPQ